MTVALILNVGVRVALTQSTDQGHTRRTSPSGPQRTRPRSSTGHPYRLTHPARTALPARCRVGAPTQGPPGVRQGTDYKKAQSRPISPPRLTAVVGDRVPRRCSSMALRTSPSICFPWIFGNKCRGLMGSPLPAGRVVAAYRSALLPPLDCAVTIGARAPAGVLRHRVPPAGECYGPSSSLRDDHRDPGVHTLASGSSSSSRRRPGDDQRRRWWHAWASGVRVFRLAAIVCREPVLGQGT